MSLRLLAAASLLAIAATAPARAETLEDAILAAYRTNPQLLAARADNRSADAVLTQSKAAYGPSIGGTVGYAYTYNRVELAEDQFTTAKGFAPSYEVTASQPVFTSGRLSAAVSGARAEVLASREELRQTEQVVLNNVISAYVRVRRDQALLAIARENLDLLSRQRLDTQERLRVRESTSTDFDQTDNRFELARGQLADAEGALQVSRAAYTAAVGRPPVDLAPQPDLMGLPISVTDAYDVAEANNPVLRTQQFRELQSRAALARARAERGPNVAVEGSASRNSTSPFNNRLRSDAVVARAVARMPIFTSGLISAQVREAKEANDREWRLADQARRDVRQSVAQSWEQLQATRNSLPHYRQAVTAAEQAFAGAKEQERVGLRATIEVLDQTRDLLQSRTTLVQAEANEYLLRVALLSAMGRLQAPLLIAGATPYDPNRQRREMSGIPGVSDMLYAIDNVVDGNLKKPRPTRDDAVRMHPPGQ